MKTKLLTLLGVAITLVACTKNLEEKVDVLGKRVDSIEAQANANAEAIKVLREAVVANDYITACTSVMDEGKLVGYTITFAKGEPITIYCGSDGVQGDKGDKGDKGDQGETGPQGPAGDSAFKSIVVGEETVVFTLADGTVITLPLEKAFCLEVETNAVAKPGQDLRLAYKVVNATSATTVDCIGDRGYVAEVDVNSSEIVISCPADFTDGKVLAYADNGAGKTSVKMIRISSEGIEIEVAEDVVPAEGGNVDVKITTNIDYTISCDSDWITWSEKTKSVREFSFTVAANPTSSTREAVIKILDVDGIAVQSFTIAQAGGVLPEGILLNGKTAFETIQAAIDASQDGDFITLPEGEYSENITCGKAIEISGADGTDKEKVVIIGTMEIFAKATLKNFTVKLSDDKEITTIANTQDNYKDWGHYIFVRLSKGADEACLENLHLIAEGQSEKGSNSASLIWVSEASDVLVKDCVVDAGSQASYCGNQCYSASVTFDGNTFNGGGRKGYAIRVCESSSVTIKGNVFNSSKYAVSINKADAFTLTVGDGETDNNTYNTEIAVHGEGFSRNDALAAGATFVPSNIVFEEAKALGEIGSASIKAVWEKIDDPSWNGSLNIASVRNVAVNWTGVYLLETGGTLREFSFTDGSLKNSYTVPGEKVGHFVADGLATLSDGTVVLSNMAGAADGQKLRCWSFSNGNFTELYTHDVVAVDGLRPRLGDMITATGNLNDGVIYLPDFNAKDGNSRIFEIFLKNGVGESIGCGYAGGTGNSSKVTVDGQECTYGLGGISSIGIFKGNGTTRIYGCGALKNRYDVILNPWGNSSSFGFTNITNHKDFLATTPFTYEGLRRSPVFFTLGESMYMAIAVMTGYDFSDSYGMEVQVYGMPNSDIKDIAFGATPVATYELKSNTSCGNAAGGISVTIKDNKAYIAAAMNNTGAALLEFSN